MDTSTEWLITASPNPTNSVVNVQVKGGEPYLINWKLVNLYGQKVMEQTTESSDFSIDLSHFSDGVYYLHIESNNEIIGILKIIKQ